MDTFGHFHGLEISWNYNLWAQFLEILTWQPSCGSPHCGRPCLHWAFALCSKEKDLTEDTFLVLTQVISNHELSRPHREKNLELVRGYRWIQVTPTWSCSALTRRVSTFSWSAGKLQTVARSCAAKFILILHSFLWSLIVVLGCYNCYEFLQEETLEKTPFSFLVFKKNVLCSKALSWLTTQNSFSHTTHFNSQIGAKRLDKVSSQVHAVRRYGEHTLPWAKSFIHVFIKLSRLSYSQL